MTPDLIELKVPDRTLDIAGSRTQKLLPIFEKSMPSDLRVLDDAVEEFTQESAPMTNSGLPAGVVAYAIRCAPLSFASD